MNKNPKIVNLVKTLLTASCLATIAAGGALAQTTLPGAATTTADPGRIQQDLMERRLPSQLSPEIEIKDMILQKAPPGAENILFELDQIAIEGVSVYDESQLRSVYADKLGTTISLAEAYVIANDLTNKYRDDGFILTQVVIPPQTIENGQMRFQVVEGYVDSITVEGNDQESALNLARQYAAQIGSNAALNVRDLERYLLQINDLPGVEARSVLSPSTSKTGAADLTIILDRDPYEAFLGVDNFGSRYLGPVQFTAAGSLNSVLGYNERITGQVVLAPIHRELGFFSLSYAQPISRYGTLIELSSSYSHTEPGFNLRQFDVLGKSNFYGVKLLQPFIRSRSMNFTGYVGFDWRDVNTKNNIETVGREDNIRAARLGGRLEALDTLFGVGINSVVFEISRGLDVFGSSDKFDANLSRPRGNPEFTKLTAEFQRLQRITADINLLAGLRGQYSANNLLSSEEFGVGGPGYGRGYDPSEIVGDDGFAGKLELQWDKPYQWNFVQDYQLYAFLDSGRTFNGDATSSSAESDTLTSTGAGIRMDFMEETQAGFMVAVPLNRDVETQSDQDPRVYVNLSRRF